MLFVLFVAVPLIELWLLFKVGAVLGPGVTLGLVIATGILGASLARSQGLAVMARVQQELREGRQPTGTMIEGFAILMAGLVLLTPGLLTDALGLLLLLPFTRRAILAAMKRRFEASVRSGRTNVTVVMGGRRQAGDDPFAGTPFGRPGAGAGPDVKDVPHVDVTPGRSDDARQVGEG